MEKKLKCIKCGLYFKDRKDPEEIKLVNRALCMNCNIVWKAIGGMIKALGYSNANRDIEINLNHVKITKKRKY